MSSGGFSPEGMSVVVGDVSGGPANRSTTLCQSLATHNDERSVRFTHAP